MMETKTNHYYTLLYTYKELFDCLCCWFSCKCVHVNHGWKFILVQLEGFLVLNDVTQDLNDLGLTNSWNDVQKSSPVNEKKAKLYDN